MRGLLPVKPDTPTHTEAGGTSAQLTGGVPDRSKSIRSGSAIASTKKTSFAYGSDFGYLTDGRPDSKNRSTSPDYSQTLEPVETSVFRDNLV